MACRSAKDSTARHIHDEPERDILFYWASVPLAHAFLRDRAARLETGDTLAVVVEDDAKTALRSSLGLAVPLAQIMGRSQFRDSSTQGIGSVVFYETEDAQRFETYIGDIRTKLESFSSRAAVTTSPSVFCTYFFEVKTGYFECHVPGEVPDSFYRRLFTAADVIYCTESRDTPQYPGIVAEIERLSAGELSEEHTEALEKLAGGSPFDVKAAMFLALKEHLFDSALIENFTGARFRSEKLAVLHNMIKQKQNEKMVVYVADADRLRLLSLILRCWSTPLSPRRDGDFCGRSEVDKNRTVINDRVLAGHDTVLDVAVISQLPREDSLSQETNLVLFDFVPALYGCHTFILASHEQAGEFRELISLDDKIEDEIRGEPDRANPGDVYRFKVLSGSFDEIWKACSKKGPARSVEKGMNHLFITSSCGAGRIQATIDLYSTVNAPILFPTLRKSQSIPGTGPVFRSSLALAVSRISLGTLTSFTAFAGPLPLSGQSYVSIGCRGLTVYSFSAGLNLRIEVPRDHIEAWVLLSVRRNQQSENTAVGCELSIPLRFSPRVFVHEGSSFLGRKLRDESPAKEKIAYFEKMEWARACHDDVPFFKERYDLQVSVPLSEASPCAFQTSPDVLSDGFSVLSSIAHIVSGYSARLVYTDVREEAIDLSFSDLVSAFESCDFAATYAVLSLISRKGRLLVNKFKKSDLQRLKSVDIPGFCRTLDFRLKRRFSRLSVADIRITRCLQNNPVRAAVVTPLSTAFGYESVPETNRVLRNFDQDKFIRFSLRDSNGAKFLSDGTVNQDGVYEYFRRIMLEGLVVGPRRYFFLAATTSQLKEHNAWFVTPYEQDGVIIGADYIKSWLGDFSSIKNIGKYAVRVGQALSTTTDTYEMHDFVEIPDVARNGYSFTDGIGLISAGHALAVSRALGLAHVPSAFQIRFAGFKGVVAVQPLLDDRETFGEWAGRNGLGDRAAEEHFGRHGLVLRSSMNKFPSAHRMFEVVTTSRSTEFFLNRQIILILEGFGIPSSVFKDLQDQFVLGVLSAMDADFPSFVRKHVPFFPRNLISTEFLFFRKLVGPVLSKVFEDLNRKSKIHVPQGRAAMGVTDELQVLEEDEVFLMYESGGAHSDGCALHGSFSVPVGPAIIAKNPCMHPGDIRVVRCVDRKELHYLKDVVVFPQKGPRPLFNQCSGSDLDGDIFLVSWNPLLIPRVTFRPYNYTNSTALSKETVLLSDMVNFYIRYLRSYQLGVIAHAFMAAADRDSVFSPEALRLGELFNRNIDFIKTGNIASIPEDLIPAAYPDYMEKLPAYRSEKVIGELYRRSSVGSLAGACECYSCTCRRLRQLSRWQEFLLRGSSILIREETIEDTSTDGGDAKSLFCEYCLEMKHLISKYNLKTEESLFCAKDPSALCELGDILKRYGREIRGASVGEIARLSTRCSEGINSLVWLSPRAYKIKTKAYVHRHKTVSGFIFNTRIHLVPHDAGLEDVKRTKTAEDATASQFYNNRFKGQVITVRADTKKINEFISLLSPGMVDAFREVFNLVLISQLHRIDEIDKIADLLICIHQKIRGFTRLEMSRVLFSLSDNTLFRIGLVLSLDISVVSKACMLREERRDRAPAERPAKIYRGLNLVISGMLDENDDVEFVASRNMLSAKTMFVPVLKNRGTCDVDYYRDNVRDFLVNILFSNECMQFGRGKTYEGPGSSAQGSHRSRVCYEMLFVPGTFYLSKLDDSLVHDRMSIGKLQTLIHRNDPAINTWFVNKHRCLDEPGLLGEAGPVKEHCILSFNFRETRYDLEYADLGLVKIARGRGFIGKEYVVNNGGAGDSAKNDLMIELIRYEVIYSTDIDVLGEDEAFMLEGGLFTLAGRSCVLSPLLSCCSNFRLEVNTDPRDEGCFRVALRAVYSGSAFRLQSGDPKMCCSASRSWFSDESFDKAFGRLWKAYGKILHEWPGHASPGPT